MPSFWLDLAMTPMKSSRYNVVAPWSDRRCVVYNTLTGAVVSTSSSLMTAVQRNSFNGLDSDTLVKLRRRGVLVEEHTDERRVAEYRYLSAKFRSRIVRFLVLTTYECNMTCPYCYQRARDRRDVMDPTTTDAALAFIESVVAERRPRRVVVGLYGGEPLLNRNCCTRICDSLRSWTADRGIELSVILTSNGVLLSDDVLHDLRPLAAVHLTLDGPKATHDASRFLMPGHKGTYDRLIAVVRDLQRKGIPVSIRLNVGDNTLPLMPSLLDDLRNRGILGAQNVRVYMQVISRSCMSPAMPDVECVPDTDDDSLSTAVRRLARMWRIESPHATPGSCPFVNDWTFIIDPAGAIYKCPLWAGSDHHSMGHLGSNGTATWRSAYYDEMSFNPCEISQCHDCIYLPTCYGGCPADSHSRDAARAGRCEIHGRKHRLVALHITRVVEANSYEAI